MAGLNGSVSTSQTQTLPVNTTRTMLQVTAPAGAGLRVKRFGVFLGDTTQTNARAEVDFVRGATGGTGASVTPVKTGGHTGTIAGTAKENFNSGGSAAEPTGGSAFKSQLQPPTQGYEAPLDVVLNPGETLGLRVKAASAIGCRAWMEFEE